MVIAVNLYNRDQSQQKVRNAFLAVKTQGAPRSHMVSCFYVPWETISHGQKLTQSGVLVFPITTELLVVLGSQ